MANAQSAGNNSLMVLPTELFDQVASLLPQSALRALALTSKKANVSAMDTLCKTYLNRTAPAKAPFHLFLCTICERPDLAAEVKRVDIRGWRSEYEVVTGAAWRGVTQVRDVNQVDKAGPSFTITTKVLRGSATKRFQLFAGVAVNARLIAKSGSISASALELRITYHTTLKDDGDFLRLLACGMEDAQLVLMLALLTNMETLRIDGLNPFPLLDWHYFLSRSSTTLRKLLALHINGSKVLSSAPTVKFSLQFLHIMPSLASIHLALVGGGGHRFALEKLPTTKLESIALCGCGINICLLRKILSGQRLSAFEYYPARPRVEEITVLHIGLLDLVALLADSRLSLKKLILFPGGDCAKRSSLKIFENMEELEMPHPWVLDIPTDEVDPRRFTLSW